MSIFTIARADLLRGLRSRSAVITSFVAPLAMAIVFGLMFSSGSSVSFSIALVDAAQSPISGSIVDSMLAEADDTVADEPVVFSRVDDMAAALAAVDDGLVGAAIVFDEADTPSGIGLTIVENPESSLSAQVAQSIASSVATSIETGGRPPVEFVDLELGGRELSAPAYFGASMAILLLFFSTGMASQSILEDRQTRTLDRILSGPTTVWSVLIGKVLAVAVLAIMGFSTVWVVTSLLFDANWGNPLGVLLLIACTVIALAGVATFVGGFAATPQQATTLTAVVTFGLSLLGGNFTGPADAPSAMRVMRRLTPNGRALEAFTELSVDAASIGSIATTLGILVAFGLGFGAVGLIQLRRTVGQ